MDDIRIHTGHIYLSYKLLEEKGISRKTIEFWKTRNLSSIIYDNNHAFVLYDSIPPPTRKKLPSKEEFIAIYKGKQSDEITESFFRRMEYAYLKGFVKYRDIYTKLVKFDDVNKYAQKHAVWAVILELHKQDCRPKLRNIWEAYNRIYPDHYTYNRMNPAIKKAKTEGIQELLIHHHKGMVRTISPAIDKWILDAMSSGKAYSQYHIHELVSELCTKYKYRTPSVSWVKNKCLQLQPLVHAQTYGTDKSNFCQMPYAGIIRAEYPGDQWQIDGYTLPFYMEGFKKLILFVVKDACTGRIVGYEIARSENTETILKGLENAVNNTGHLPYEIVSDNHSFNKTKEAEYFKKSLDAIGTTWTVSENPRYKSIVERGFRTFAEKFLKSEYGYIGEGVKTNNPKGRISQDLFDKYYSKVGGILTEDQIKLIAIKCVEAFNKKNAKDGTSPVTKYNETEKPHIFSVDKIDCLRLFIRSGENTVSRDQITLERGGVKYEFQLTAACDLALNNKKVRIRYTDFDEIHLFDLKTDKYLCSVPRKLYAHGAKANQAEKDIKILNQNSGRLKGIKTAKKRKQIEIAQAAAEADPDAAYAMNARLTPKDIIREFEENGVLREQADRLGINLDTVPNIPIFSEVQTINPEPDAKVTRRLKSPFMPENHVMTEITDSDYEDN